VSTSKAGSMTTPELPSSVLALSSPNQTPPTLSGECGRFYDFARIRCHCIHSIRIVICYTRVSFMCWLSSKLHVSLFECYSLFQDPSTINRDVYNQSHQLQAINLVDLSSPYKKGARSAHCQEYVCCCNELTSRPVRDAAL
jgi:hypothetical protein